MIWVWEVKLMNRLAWFYLESYCYQNFINCNPRQTHLYCSVASSLSDRATNNIIHYPSQHVRVTPSTPRHHDICFTLLIGTYTFIGQIGHCQYIILLSHVHQTQYIWEVEDWDWDQTPEYRCWNDPDFFILTYKSVGSVTPTTNLWMNFVFMNI